MNVLPQILRVLKRAKDEMQTCNKAMCHCLYCDLRSAIRLAETFASPLEAATTAAESGSARAQSAYERAKAVNDRLQAQAEERARRRDEK